MRAITDPKATQKRLLTKISPGRDVKGGKRQLQLIIYSPLFVDLIDNYNQGASTSGPYNYDTIKNFPHTTIQTMAATCTDKSAIQSKRQEYVGVYYTSSELAKFLQPYNDAF